MNIKHFIAIRFYPFVFGRYDEDITDYEFLKKNFSLLRNNVIKSLEGQTNKNFEVVILYNSSLDLEEYDFMDKDNLSTTLKITFIGVKDQSFSEYREYVSNFHDKCDYIIETRIDHDDFVFNGAVNDIQSKINDGIDLLAYGYCSGYTYIDGNFYDFYTDCHSIGVWSVFSSIMYKTNVVKSIFPITIYSSDHGKLKTIIDAAKLKNSSINAVFLQNKTTKAFIWYRHKDCWSTHGVDDLFSIDTLASYAKRKLLNPILTNKDKEYIANTFSFNYSL